MLGALWLNLLIVICHNFMATSNFRTFLWKLQNTFLPCFRRNMKPVVKVYKKVKLLWNISKYFYVFAFLLATASISRRKQINVITFFYWNTIHSQRRKLHLVHHSIACLPWRVFLAPHRPSCLHTSILQQSCHTAFFHIHQLGYNLE